MWSYDLLSHHSGLSETFKDKTTKFYGVSSLQWPCSDPFDMPRSSVWALQPDESIHINLPSLYQYGGFLK